MKDKLYYVSSEGCDSFIAKSIEQAIEIIKNTYGYTDRYTSTPYMNGELVSFDNLGSSLDEGHEPHTFTIIWCEDMTKHS